MSTINRVFIDSSVFVEAMKGNQTAFYKKIVELENTLCCINEVVLSEYLFYILSINGNAAPKTLHRNLEIPNIISRHINTAKALSAFDYIPNDAQITNKVPELMIKHNLLPNDAIILATCLAHRVTKLATLDFDFKPACIAEGIEFIHPDSI